MKVLILTLALLFSREAATAQTHPPVVYSSAPKTVSIVIHSGKPNEMIVSARVSYTITAANSDDTLTGTLTCTLPDPARRQIAEARGRQLAEVPATLAQKDIVARFRKSTACPVIHVEIGPVEIDAAGLDLDLDRFVLEINESRDEMSQLLCFWTKQLNTNRPRRGIISKINRLITGEDESQ
jgi:hypothetical protein